MTNQDFGTIAARLRLALSTAADLITVIGVAAGALVIAGGFVVGQTGMGLAIALLISGSIIVALTFAYRRSRKRAVALERELANAQHELAQLQSAVDQQRRQPIPRRNRWIGTQGDLTTLVITNAHLEAAYEAARMVAAQRLGPDVEVRFAALRLMLFLGGAHFAVDYPDLHFDAFSPSAGREALLTYSGTDETCRVNNLSRVENPFFLSDEPTPWRIDDGWRRLVEMSWLRMRPFVGDVSLLWSGGSWRVTYARWLDDQERAADETYELDEAGNLTRV
jgi:hypothetical protein